MRSGLQGRASVPRAYQAPNLAILLLLSVLIAVTTIVQANDSDPAQKEPDHPLIVVGFASADRLLDRVSDAVQSTGRSFAREDALKFLANGGYSKFHSMEHADQWLDFTKPCGLMVFYSVNAAGPTVDRADAITLEDPNGFLSFLRDLNTSNINVSRNAVFLPVKDFTQYLSLNNLTRVTGNTNCYQDPNGDFHYLRRFGNYIVVGTDGDVIDNCPDPKGLLNPWLDKNDMVASLQLKGLPPLLRKLGAETIKAAYDASLQQRDDEPEREYMVRRALGELLREGLDMAVSHIDAISLGLRVDPTKRKHIFEIDLAGDKDGKLAKFAAEFVPRKSPFETLWDPDNDYSMALSLAFPERHTKPIADAVRNYVATATGEEKEVYDGYASLVDIGLRLLDSRQIDVIAVSPAGLENGETVLGLKIPAGPRFPEQFQKLIEKYASTSQEFGDISTGVDEIYGWPAHRIDERIPFFFLTPITVCGIGGIEVDQDFEGATWVVATPQALWIANTTEMEESRMPACLKACIERHTEVKPVGTAISKSTPFRLAMQFGGIVKNTGQVMADDEESEIQEDNQIEQIKNREVSEDSVSQLVLEMENRIAFEAQTTPFGVKLTIQVDQLYLLILGAQVMDLLEPGPPVNASPEVPDEN